MRLKKTFNAMLLKSGLAASFLLLSAGAATAQVALTAQASSTTLPDGQTVPMWGLSCDVPGPTCKSLNSAATTASIWSPPVITVQTGTPLIINLTNKLVVPTSLVIVGQIGGGLGGGGTTSASPAHGTVSTTTWPIVGTAVTPFTPPTQGPRVQSFATELAPAGATPSTTQCAASPCSLTWSSLSPGTYLLESGTHPSIQGPMGLYGIVVVTTSPTPAKVGTAYPAPSKTVPAVTYDSEVPLLLSEIDPVQNTTVSQAVAKSGFSEATVWSGQPGGCGYPGTIATPNPNYLTCYPPAVNYDPRYYLINGVSFDRTNLAASSLTAVPAAVAATTTTPATATTPATSAGVLLRFVNAGLRMHVPSVVGANMSLIAEDGNLLPGTPKVQNEVFLAAGKTYDAIIHPGANSSTSPATYNAASFPVYDRQLSLSTNNQRDGGMQAYLLINGGAAANAPGGANSATSARANNDSYFLVPGNNTMVADLTKGLIANDVAVTGVTVLAGPTNGTLTLNANGTFTYIPKTGYVCATTPCDSFTYCANGSVTGGVCSSDPTASKGLIATVNLVACTGTCLGNAPTANADSYVSNIASKFQVGAPGILTNDTDPQGHPLTASAATGVTGGTVTVNPDGSFTAQPATPPVGATATATVTFKYTAINSQKTPSAPATVSVTFNGASGLAVKVVDGPSAQPLASPANTPLTDYRWIIEEDRTFNINPALANGNANPCTSPGVPAGCTPYTPTTSLGTNFHTAYMPVVASGCVGTYACESGQTVLGSPAVCDIGNGICRTGAAQQTPVDPSQVHLDPNKRYYISILPGDAGNSFTSASGAPKPDPSSPSGMRQFSIAQDCGTFSPTAANWAAGTGICGHSMGGAPLAAGQTAATVLVQETPYLPSKISVFVFEDDYPLNGENDAGGGVDVLAPLEPGLGGFEVRLWDDAGGPGDATGQLTHDMFNMPLSNSLAGTIDPTTGFDACPISPTSTDGLVGRIVTCPTYEYDTKHSKVSAVLSPLAGQAVIANMMPGRYGVQADPGADRYARGEEWLQTNTLDGQKAHDSFIKVGGPAYFQEFGPAGFHVVIGFANPAIINARLPKLCAGTDVNLSLPKGTACNNTVTGTITMERQSRSPDQRLYSSGDNTALSFTQCYVSIGDPDGEDFQFTKCDSSGKFVLSGIPDGDWRITVFDQWNDQIVDGLSTPVRLTGGKGYNFGQLPKQQWHTDVVTSTFLDLNQNGVRDANEPGLLLAPTNNRYRDGSFSNFNNTDLNGHASFNEIFPLFNWYVMESDQTRFKQTGVHVVYDAGGPADGTAGGGSSTIAAALANTAEKFAVPANLRVPGAVYCDNADCNGFSIANGPGSSSSPSTTSSGRIDPPWALSEAWQGFIGSYEFMEFGKTPYIVGENGGIHGEVIYASTRPFDDPALLIHTSWTPDIPGVTINLYQEGIAADGTQTLTLVDTTTTSSWDDWAQGFRSDGVPNMNCPGQGDASYDLYYYTLKDTPQELNQGKALPYDSRYKCYDGLHNFNQVQPAPYDGMYRFPSVTARNTTTGKPSITINATTGLVVQGVGTNCAVCVPNKSGDGTPMLPAGKYVVEVVVPPGYELVKEEDKNILIGDNYIAPVTQQFAGIGNVFILPDQAAVNAQYNANNAQNPTNGLGVTTLPIHEGDTGSVESKWPCVGTMRTVPDFISLFPYSKEVAPFAGASRPLCDRKEVVVQDQTGALAKFWLFSSTHVAAHFTGFILDDLSSEFDPFSPQFGEKFAVPNLPVSIKDFAGNEVLRTYTDQWGVYNGLNYSTWEVNPPNPTGYAPTMMVACMNDPGNGATPDPYYNPSYSQFCYEIPYMPGQTQYMDTPVIPTAAFAEGYNPPDCNYPDATPAVAAVLGDAIGSGAGPWVSAAGHTLKITALGGGSAGAGVQVPNPAYSGPQATTAPFNQKFLNRHYGFGATQGTGSVTIGGVNAPVAGGGWSDASITVTVPAGIPSCDVNGAPLQRGNGSANALFAARCGELLITAGNGKQSIDAVTVTVGGKTPTYIQGENATSNVLQLAIDKAQPGDMILVGPGTYNEMLLMWKPIRLQGVGAASVTINANTHPSGKMDPWRRQVNCLFGLSTNGSLLIPGTGLPNNVYDPTGVYSSVCPGFDPTNPLSQQGKVDPLPLEGIIGWDTTLNGNLAQLLQEPSLMGAYEGAVITVLGKGESLSIDAGAGGVNGSGGDFPAGSRLLTGSNTDCKAFPSNYYCNPSRIDGLTLTNSSQGGGGIYVHAWNQYLEISNNRIHGNAGTLSGGINVGQGESPDAILGTTGAQTDVQQPFLFYQNVRVHHNSITANSSYGDELFSASPSAAGGVSFCTGADYYHFNYNWVCGNLSTGDGGGLVHVGFIYNGDISHNWILFNQSNNITLPTNGGGIAVLGASPDGMTVATPGNPSVECGNTITDVDCAPGLSDGTGPGLKIDSNLIVGNTAESGSGGGIRLQTVNGTEVARFPKDPSKWYDVQITNNIIANNVAGWDGGGVSMQDALKVKFINNTVASNDTTASSGVLFNTLGAPGASTPPPGCDPTNNPTCAGNEVTKSTPQVAGLVTMQNTANLTSSLPATVICPTGNYAGTTSVAHATNGTCRSISYPLIENDLFWQNRSFNILVGNAGTGLQTQQNLVTLVPSLNQGTTGQCVTGANYWDIGVRGDTAPTDHSSTVTLAPSYSILTSTAGYATAAAHNQSANPNLASQYCNGSHVPPENGGFGYQVPPGISDATLPNPAFNLTPAATVDEGNNWINMAYGPLSLANPQAAAGAPALVGTGTNGTANGNYGLTSASTDAINAIPNGTANYDQAPALDYFGTQRKTNRAVDIGAVEFTGAAAAVASVTGGPLAFGNVADGTTSAAQTVTLNNTGGAILTGITVTPAGAGFARPAGAAGGTCGATLGAGATCTIAVTFSPATPGLVNGTLTVGGSVAVAGSPVALSGTGVAPVISAQLSPATWTTSATRGIGFFGPVMMFTLTNTGNATLSGIGQGTLGGTSPADYAVLLSTCGAITPSLNPGGSCFVLVQFRPRTGDTKGSTRSATVSVTDAAGTQTSTLTGTAN